MPRPKRIVVNVRRCEVCAETRSNPWPLYKCSADCFNRQHRLCDACAQHEANRVQCVRCESVHCTIHQDGYWTYRNDPFRSCLRCDVHGCYHCLSHHICCFGYLCETCRPQHELDATCDECHRTRKPCKLQTVVCTEHNRKRSLCTHCVETMTVRRVSTRCKQCSRVTDCVQARTIQCATPDCTSRKSFKLCCEHAEHRTPGTPRRYTGGDKRLRTMCTLCNRYYCRQHRVALERCYTCHQTFCTDHDSLYLGSCSACHERWAPAIRMCKEWLYHPESEYVRTKLQVHWNRMQDLNT